MSKRRKKAKARKAKKKVRSNLGNIYKSKKWALRFARGRPVRYVTTPKRGWKICRKPKRRS